jgi:hypothetical protein
MPRHVPFALMPPTAWAHALTPPLNSLALACVLSQRLAVDGLAHVASPNSFVSLNISLSNDEEWAPSLLECVDTPPFEHPALRTSGPSNIQAFELRPLLYYQSRAAA